MASTKRGGGKPSRDFWHDLSAGICVEEIVEEEKVRHGFLRDLLMGRLRVHE